MVGGTRGLPLRGRGGVAIGNVLLYGTAGLAYGGLTATTPGNLSESHTSFGWAAGGGAEVGFTPHWSAKAEWLYLDFASHNFSVTGADNGLTANLRSAPPGKGFRDRVQKRDARVPVGGQDRIADTRQRGSQHAAAFAPLRGNPRDQACHRQKQPEPHAYRTEPARVPVKEIQ